MPNVSIIGVGRIGGALANAFHGSIFSVEHLFGRRHSVLSEIQILDEVREISTEIVIISTQDTEISAVAQQLAQKLTIKSVVLHTSGSLSSHELSELAKAGHSVGSMHPLVSINTTLQGNNQFLKVFFCVEGDSRAVETAKEIVAFLGGQTFEIPTENKVLYHASAVAACGHLTALLDVAFSMMESSGVGRESVAKILMPLIRSTINNIAEHGTAVALTGTFARADVAGFERQLAAFNGKLDIKERNIYLDLAERSLEIALRQGADPENVKRILDLILIAKTGLQ